MSNPSILRKRPSPGNFVTSLKQGESLTVDGEATFRIIETNHKGHKTESKISVTAPKETKIFKNWNGVKK